jgi:Ca2+-binding EF-hand superfamily protein
MGEIIDFIKPRSEQIFESPVAPLHPFLETLTDQLYNEGREEEAAEVLEAYDRDQSYMLPAKALARAIRHARSLL